MKKKLTEIFLLIKTYKFIVLAIVVLALFVFSISLNIKQSTDLKNCNSAIDNVINTNTLRYRDLNSFNSELKDEIKNRRVSISEGNIFNYHLNFRAVGDTLSQMEDIYLGIYPNDVKNVLHSNNLDVDIDFIDNFYDEINNSKLQYPIVRDGTNHYIVLKGRAYQEVLIISHIIGKLNSIRNTAYKKKNNIDIWREILYKNKEFFDSNDFNINISMLQNINSRMSAIIGLT